jgi:hypothetical protein
MKQAFSARIKGMTGIGAISVLVLLLSGCTEPVHVAWNGTQSVIEPEIPPPQGELDVYSESYVFYDADVPRIHRRPVEVYSVDGQLVAGARDQDGEGPIHLALTPGHYIVTSESHMQGRQVQVDVQDGRKTVVAESQLDHAPLLASSQAEGSARLAAHHSGSSR